MPDDPFEQLDSSVFDGPPLIFLIFFGVVALMVVGVFATVVVVGVRRLRANNAAPLRSIDALVVSKRTAVSGGAGDARTSSSYYATFEDEAGTRIELPLSGADYGQLAEGDRGHLIHQGTRFKGFTRNPVLEA